MRDGWYWLDIIGFWMEKLMLYLKREDGFYLEGFGIIMLIKKVK